MKYIFWFAIGYCFEYERAQNEKWNVKKSSLAFIILLVLVVTIGGAYALWTYSKTLGDQTLISGDIYMKFIYDIFTC